MEDEIQKTTLAEKRVAALAKARAAKVAKAAAQLQARHNAPDRPLIEEEERAWKELANAPEAKALKREMAYVEKHGPTTFTENDQRLEEPAKLKRKVKAFHDEPLRKDNFREGPRVAKDGRLEVVGHGGEVLSRTRTQVGDIFDIPKAMWPKGWSYQWNAVSIAGNKDILLDQTHMMWQNGWRPVPAERYAGTLVPKGSTGPIIRGQQMLMERPEALTIEAQLEEEQKAKQLISDRNDALKLSGVKKELGHGYEMNDRYKGTGGGIRMQIDKSLDVLNVNRQSGNYTLDE